MKYLIYRSFFLCVFSFLCFSSLAQLPVCSGLGSGLIYYVSNGNIYNYAPTLPLSSTNPSLNTISLPTTAVQCLAVNNNINASSPSPTFYTIDSGNFFYYNGSGWTNTGHNAGGNVNIGGAGPYIYNMNSGATVYKYDGTSNATFLINVPTPSSCVADLVGDNQGNFYLINPQNTQWLKEFNSSGTLINTWTMSGSTSSGGGGGFAYIGSHVYYNNSSGLWDGIVSGSNVAFTQVTSLGLSPQPQDFGSCPLGPLGVLQANVDTAYYCAGAPGTLLYANGSGPYTWSVLSGPAVISGSGDSVYITSTGNSQILLSSSGSSNTDTVTFLVNPVPLLTINSNSPVCSGNTLNLYSGSNPAASVYHWTGPNGFSNSNQNPSVSNIILPDSGYYYVSDTLNGCYNKDSIYVSVKRTPSLPIAGSNSPICAGDTLKLTASDTTSNINYSWSGPGAFSSILQNPVLANAQAGNTGIYTVNVNLNGCSSSSTIAVNINSLLGPPTINISPNPDTICVGHNVTLSAAVTNAVNPVYHWRKNGINFGPNAPSFTTANIANGDIITCEISSSALCQPTDTGLSNALHMHVLILPPPNITMSIYPINYVNGDTVTFTGHVPNGSTGLSYAWTKNGVVVPGITSTFFTTSNVHAGDTICFIAYSSIACTYPDSSVVCEGLKTTGISSWAPSSGDIHIYPNPVTNELFVEGVEIGTAIKLYNIIGQEIYWQVSISQKEIINTGKLSRGTYILELRKANGDRTIYKISK